MNIDEVSAEIVRLEQEPTTYQNCSKLAVLYSIRDHAPKQRKTAAYSNASSEFLQAAGTAPFDEVLDILDEHMQAIQVLHPKEYAAVIKRIKSI